MHSDPRQHLVEILTIVGYEDDKQKFADAFVVACLEKAMDKVIGTMDPALKEQLGQKIKGAKSADELITQFGEYIDPSTIQKAITQTVSQQLEDYFKTVIPLLSPDKREKLLAYLNTFTAPGNPKSPQS